MVSSDSLTTTRINRLLRPLRNKCNTLASVAKLSALTPTTYSSQAAWSSHDSPPLTILQPPWNVGIRIHLDDDYMRTVELARRIYAVRDCFRNVVQVTFGTGGTNCSHGIPSLGEMCSMVIGATIQTEFDENVAAKSKNSHDYVEDDEVIESANNVYEAVPPHYRRWTTVTHALSMILNTCPHHPTLLTVLLDVCLKWCLSHESCTLLRALLVASVSPAMTPSPICHPAHSSFLLDLYTRWTAEHHDAINRRSTSAKSIFVHILVDVLTDTNMPDTWTCKAVTKLAREVRKTEFVSFIHLAAGLADTIGHAQGERCVKSGGRKACDMAIATGPRDQLKKWVKSMLEHLWTSMDKSKSEIVQSAEPFGELQSIVEFLGHMQSSGLRLVSVKSVTMESELQGSVTCLATFCLSTLSSQSSDTADVRDLVNLLSETTPITSTFDELVTLILNDKDLSYIQKDWHDSVLHKLRKLATLLRSHSILKLEASLWACALRYLERNSFSKFRLRDDVEAVKRQIIDAVDEAELRCFGSIAEQSKSKPSQRRKNSPSEEGSLENKWEWEWEEMVGCWIRRSPVIKRPRLYVQQSTIHSQRVLRSAMHRQPRRALISPSPPRSISSSTVFSRSSARATSDSSVDFDVDEEDHDGKEHIVPPRQVTPRQISNFASILADAQMNRTVLHLEPPSAVHQLSAGLHITTGSYIPDYRKKITSDDDLVPFLDDPYSALPSDDSLDLFAHAQSSPRTH